MTGGRIHLRPEAHQALLALDKAARRRLQRAIDGLASQSRPTSAVDLAGLPGAVRLPVGDHQLVYTVLDNDILGNNIPGNNIPGNDVLDNNILDDDMLGDDILVLLIAAGPRSA
jgi:mRNA-degrading endonuclease RelE of RelBE toxin-antitoxin system